MKKLSRLIAILLIVALLCSVFSSCNDLPDDKGSTDNSEAMGGTNDGAKPSLPSYGCEVGNRCIPTDLDLVSDSGTVNITDYVGKIVVINFWGTWCGPCKSELPHFDEVADEYSDSVVILTVHSNYYIKNAPEYIEDNFSNSKMIFAKDNTAEGYYSVLNPGQGSYPVNIILNKDGVITYKEVGAISKETLLSEIEKAK